MDRINISKEKKIFQRCIENFVCENCDFEVKGNGYTNHCTHCLVSKHVDINPGDREAMCKGLMKPIDYIHKNRKYVIIHECEKCGFVRRNKASESDNIDILFKLSHRHFFKSGASSLQ